MTYGTILYEVGDDKVATVTLNRPEKLNAFDLAMREDFSRLWREVQSDDAVNAVVLRGAGDKAFCAGIDVAERAARIEAGTDVGARAANPFSALDPAMALAPKGNKCWKPVIAAVHGICAGGAFYWINECDIVICSQDATFFDPHVTFGMTSSLEPIGLRWRVSLGETIRWAIMGLDERWTAEHALRIGLVTEVLPRDELWPRAHELAACVASKPTIAVQGTLKAIWQSLSMTRDQAFQMGLTYTQLGNPIGEAQVDRATVTRPKPQLR
jgi:enoyl-CoA hydratase/carnithine racemase